MPSPRSYYLYVYWGVGVLYGISSSSSSHFSHKGIFFHKNNVMVYRRKRSAYRPAARRRKVVHRKAYRTRRRLRAKASRRTVTRTVGFHMPDRYRTKLRYSQTVHIFSTAGVPTGWIFKGNSLHTPSGSAAGHQPYGFNQLSTFYSSYVVTGSSIKCVGLPDGGSTSAPFQLVVLPMATSTQPFTTDAYAYREVPYARWRNVNNSSNALSRSTIINHYMPVHKLRGVSPRRVLDNPEYSASTSTSPNARFYWLVAGFPFSETAFNQDYFVQCTITYYVNFFGRRFLTPS